MLWIKQHHWPPTQPPVARPHPMELAKRSCCALWKTSDPWGISASFLAVPVTHATRRTGFIGISAGGPQAHSTSTTTKYSNFRYRKKRMRPGNRVEQVASADGVVR
jgi:hypothetical protein